MKLVFALLILAVSANSFAKEFSVSCRESSGAHQSYLDFKFTPSHEEETNYIYSGRISLSGYNDVDLDEKTIDANDIVSLVIPMNNNVFLIKTPSAWTMANTDKDAFFNVSIESYYDPIRNMKCLLND